MPEYISVGELGRFTHEDIDTGAEAFDGMGAEALGQDEGVAPWTRTPLYALEGTRQEDVALERMEAALQKLRQTVAVSNAKMVQVLADPSVRKKLAVYGTKKVIQAVKKMGTTGNLGFWPVDEIVSAAKATYYAGQDVLIGTSVGQTAATVNTGEHLERLAKEQEERFKREAAAAVTVEEKTIAEEKAAKAASIAVGARETVDEAMKPTAVFAKETARQVGKNAGKLLSGMGKTLAWFGKYWKWFVIGGAGIAGLTVLSTVRSFLPAMPRRR